MSCTDPNPQTGNTIRGNARATQRAAEEQDRAAEAARLEVELHARSIAHDAYYANHDPAPGVILVPATERPLSRDAALFAHGFIHARVKTHLYRATHAWVCLDCRWVSAFTDDGIDQIAERDAHICPEVTSR